MFEPSDAQIPGAKTVKPQLSDAIIYERMPDYEFRSPLLLKGLSVKRDRNCLSKKKRRSFPVSFILEAQALNQEV